MDPRWQHVAVIFDQARALPSSGRRAFLDEACAGDAALRAEVESLIDADESAGGFLEQPAAHVDEALPLPRPTPFAAGKLAGPYLVQEELGRGGMGHVYLAVDTRLGRQVALKVLPPDWSDDPHRRARLRLEARAAATLSHPGIATVYALDDIDGHLCIVGEYIKGRTLRDLIANARPSLRRAVDIAIQLARALDAAHRQHVVHRDLKPENVMIDEGGTVKILDFGIARLGPDGAGAGPRLTKAGAVLGTPGYMAPEQIEGAEVDIRGDIFSLGALLYELVSGVQPFDAATQALTAVRVLTDEPAPLAHADAPVPGDLDRLVRRCLRKNRDDRYATPAELLAALESLRPVPDTALIGLPPAMPRAPETPARRHPRTWWRVHQVVVMAVLAGLTVPAWTAANLAGGVLGPALFFLALACAAAGGTLRAHLLFTERQTPAAAAARTRAAARWTQGSDLGYAVALAGLAALVARAHPVLAAVLLAVGCGLAVATLVIEPTTRRDAF